MIVCIPVGFTLMIDGFSSDLNGASASPADVNTIGVGALLYLGAQLCAIVLLLLIWWSASARPEALFGEKAPEKAFRGYMTWRLFLQLVSFITYVVLFFVVVLLPARWPEVLALLILLVGTRWLILALYRRRHRQDLDLSLGSDDTMRVQLFSDAIFAVAITIAVAQIDPAAKVDENLSLLGTYVFSFLFLGVYWLLHYRIFAHVRRLNSTLILFNFWFLLLIVLAFIPARLYTGNMYDKGHIILFSIYQLATAGTLFVLWQYAKRRREHTRHLLKAGITRQQQSRLSWILGANAVIFLGLAVLAYFVPIITTLYVMAYLGLLGLVWLVAHGSTRAVKTA